MTVAADSSSAAVSSAPVSASAVPPGTVMSADQRLTSIDRSCPTRAASPAPGRYRGSVTVVQSAFGIKPYTGFFGALKLRDEVVAEFEVDLSRAV